MRNNLIILTLSLACLLRSVTGEAQQQNSIAFDFFGEPVTFTVDPAVNIEFNDSITSNAIQSFYSKIKITPYQSLVDGLLAFKKEHQPDDWLFYQLIRKTAQQISPKADNYPRYTLYKWFLLTHTGYDAILSISQDKVLFYVQSDEKIYNIPSRLSNGKQYVCLNFHDYKNLDLDKEKFAQLSLPVQEAIQGFSYKVTQLPEFRNVNYQEKDLQFNYYQNNYHFKLKINPAIKAIFANYPVVDYEYYFNIPMSKETYGSLIPLLKKNMKGMNEKKGVDYLMRFTRYAFLFEPDTEVFGGEKRLSPEQTLSYDQSDCEDRAALFFYLVKEIYNLPMLVLAYPSHVTIAVQFEKPVGKPIIYNGNAYSICEPTPQKEDMAMGELLPSLRKSTYEIAYVYEPAIRK